MDAAGWVQCDENTHSSGCASEAHRAVGAEEKSETGETAGPKNWNYNEESAKVQRKGGVTKVELWWTESRRSRQRREEVKEQPWVSDVERQTICTSPATRRSALYFKCVCVWDTGRAETGYTSRIGHSVKLRFNCRFLFYFSSALLNVTHFKKSGLGGSPWHWCVCFAHTGTFLFVISSNISCSLDTFVDITQPLNSKCDMITQSGETLNIEISPYWPWRKIQGQSVPVCSCVTVTITGDYSQITSTWAQWKLNNLSHNTRWGDFVWTSTSGEKERRGKGELRGERREAWCDRIVRVEG